MEICEVSFATNWARFVVVLDSLQAVLAEAVATARGLVGLSQDVETDGALCLEELGRWLHKFALESMTRNKTLRHLARAVSN